MRGVCAHCRERGGECPNELICKLELRAQGGQVVGVDEGGGEVLPAMGGRTGRLCREGCGRCGVYGCGHCGS